MSPTAKRNSGIAAATLIVALLLGYWFFMHTVRGSSFAVYIIGGWNAPLGVKWKCGAETDIAVDKKFELPLLFDKETKDELRGFWYYSYFRQCLYDAGYDFKGNPIPESVITDGVYTNTYGGFSFTVAGDATLLSSNRLDVDFHDQLLVSTIGTGGSTLFIHTYLKVDDFKTFEDLQKNLAHISVSRAGIETSTTKNNAHGIDFLRIRDEDNTEGIVFLTKDQHVVYLYGSSEISTTLDAIETSLTTF